MKKKFFLFYLLVIILLFYACSNSGDASSFSILFMDVGQGDAALVECDGHYMLIDGGDTTAGDIIYNTLEEKRVQKLDILAISHMHKDHFGGLIKALTYASSIGKTISNSTYSETETFQEFEHQLGINGSKITVPKIGDVYSLGSAKVEVIDVANSTPNDSLVLLITYKKTRFLFTGDIEDTGQKRIADKYENEPDSLFKIDILKMPHHGADSNSLIRFIRTFMPDYAIISVGDNNYGHPNQNALDRLSQAGAKIYRTDRNGNILVISDGTKISVSSEK